MKKALFLFVSISYLCSACVPSFQYRLGQGFYSPTFAKTQVQAAATKGTLKNLGRFTVSAGACFNYSQDLADHNIVIPAIEEVLREKGANVADNVVANEKWYDFFLGLLIVPAVMGCSVWTISGEALLVQQDALNELEGRKIAGYHSDGAWIFFRDGARQDSK